MTELKGLSSVAVSSTPSDAQFSDSINAEATRSTAHDAHDMKRMGHKQELVRYFSLWKSTAFTCVALLSWEFTIFTINQGLTGGGRAGLIWSYMWCFVGYLPVFLCMAEMASMAPISGSQYHWVSELAPEEWQKPLSYITGWMSTLAWQAGNAQGFLLTGQLIQVIIYLRDDSYGLVAWQGTLMTIAIAVASFFCNFYFTKYLPNVQNVMFFLHAGLFIIFIVVIAALAPKASNDQVWTDFSGTGGWQPGVLGVLAGQLSALSGNSGADTVTHLSEELHDAGRNAPRAMIAAYLANGVFSISAVLAMLYALPDVDAALSDPTEYPVIYILRQCMSEACLVSFMVGIIVILFAGNINYLLAISRDLWAFARDRGTPFAQTLSAISSRRSIPTNAIIASSLIASVLSLLYIGSSVAYYALVSLFQVATLQCYLISLLCLLWRRVHYPETLPAARWSLGRFGLPCNILAVLWAIWAFFWAFWPQTAQVDPSSFNWACVMFVGVLMLSGIMYWAGLRRVYDGPVVLVAGRKGNADIDSASTANV